jgi:hypothetical protein
MKRKVGAAGIGYRQAGRNSRSFNCLRNGTWLALQPKPPLDRGGVRHQSNLHARAVASAHASRFTTSVRVWRKHNWVGEAAAWKS